MIKVYSVTHESPDGEFITLSAILCDSFGCFIRRLRDLCEARQIAKREGLEIVRVDGGNVREYKL